jgi:hypothetical protein
MKFVRPANLLLLVLLAASGCRTAGVDNLARRDPMPPSTTLDAREVIAAHNRNAEKIQSFETRGRLTVATGGRPNPPVDGRLAMERPRKFKLDILHSQFGQVADIGSNDEKFWFWVRSDPKDRERVSYYCAYKDVDTTPLVATLQPDWIVEALGFRVIPDEEVKDISITRGEAPDTLVLTHHPSKHGGETVVRKTIVRESTRQIQEHQLYSDKMVLLASAKIESYQRLPVSNADGIEEVVTVPQKMRLEWKRERLTMDVNFSTSPKTTKVNSGFAGRDELFVEQPHKGYERVNLAKVAPRVPRGRTEIRETRPAPPTGVQLGAPEPSPIGADGAARISSDPVALTADLPARPPLTDELVDPAQPKAPELQFAKPTATWRNAVEPGYQR